MVLIKMPGNLIGKSLQLLSWGESHGPTIGGVIDGVPPNILIDTNDIQHQLNRRKPGQNHLTTPRKENDEVEILSGVFNNQSLGTPIAFMVRNQDQRSQDYDKFKNIYRPGHGDFSYQQKYGIRDHRGGGRASARTTISTVVAGAIATQILKKLYPSVSIRAAITQLGEHKVNRDNWLWETTHNNLFHCPDAESVNLWESYLKNLSDNGKSCGAVIEVHAQGLPAGLGEPVFDRLDADLAHILMGINAVKGVEIGMGFDCVSAEQAFDEMHINNENEYFNTNHAGGILAGISTGQPIVAQIAFKPTSSTKQPRKSITTQGEEVTIQVDGRHDPCVALRAIPIVESAIAFVLADHALRWRAQCG